MAFDLIIRGGAVIDGSGKPGRQADVAVSGGKIQAVGSLPAAEAAAVIDASGHVVAPGFIDMHSHSDVTLLDDPGGESKAHQGVTTEVTGNCSYSPFPAGSAGPKTLREQLGSLLISNVEWTWNTLDDWASDLESNGVSLNVAPQVGQAALRVAAGATENRPASPDEMREMRRLASEAFEQGAFSLSTGLSFAPSAYASTEELVSLCEAVARYDGAFYATHARTGAGKHITMIEEAVEIGRRASVPVQFSHISITDRRFYGDGPKMLALLEQARADGLDITYDIYPYTAAGSNFNETIPLWVQKGSNDEYMARLRDLPTRERVRDELTRAAGGLRPLWDTWQVAYVGSDANKGLIGMTVEEIARDRGVEPEEAVLQVNLEEEGVVSVVVHNRAESDVRYFMSQPIAMFGSDGRAVSPDGLYASAKPHPRFYGAYPRVLGRYVREDAVMPLETAVHKMTGFPARRLGLRDRGLIREGLAADLVVFDPNAVMDRATFEDPHQYPDGIAHVFVNGVAVIADGKHTGARPGRALRRGQ